MIEPVCFNQYESQVSFDVVSFFTLAPSEAASTILIDRLSNDQAWKNYNCN